MEIIFKEENGKLMEKINEINKNNEILLQENIKLKKEVESNKSLIENLQHTINKNLLEINDYVAQNEELLKKIKQLKYSRKGSIPESFVENEKLMLTIAAQKGEINDLQEFIMNLNVEKKTLIDTFTQEIDELTEKNKKLENENALKDKEVNNLKEKVIALEKEVADDKKELEKLKETLIELEKNQKIMEEKEALYKQKQLEEFNKKLKEIDDLNKIIEEKVEFNKKLENENNLCKEEIDRNKNEIDELNKKSEELQNILKEKDEINKKLESDYNSLEKENNNNKNIINKLNSEVSQTKVALANITFEREEEINELRVKVRKLTTKLESMGVKFKK